jgi:hypothetical protein
MDFKIILLILSLIINTRLIFYIKELKVKNYKLGKIANFYIKKGIKISENNLED